MLIYGLIIATIALSLSIWGLLRTALWLIPALFAQDYLPLACASLAAFFAVASWIFPYRKEAFDGRDLPREKMALLFFLTGVVTGSLVLSTSQIWIFAAGAAFPWILLQAFRVFRVPAGRILYLPKQIRFVTTGLCVVVILARLAEEALQIL